MARVHPKGHTAAELECIRKGTSACLWEKPDGRKKLEARVGSTRGPACARVERSRRQYDVNHVLPKTVLARTNGVGCIRKGTPTVGWGASERAHPTAVRPHGAHAKGELSGCFRKGTPDLRVRPNGHTAYEVHPIGHPCILSRVHPIGHTWILFVDRNY